VTASPVVPAVALLEPLPGAIKNGAQLAATHSGSAVLHRPEDKQTALLMCDNV
jgi:hypothetical protein